MPDGDMETTIDSVDHRLDVLRRLVHAIQFDSWFAAVGDPVIDAERDEARLYLDGLGFGDVTIRSVDGWQDAKAIADAPDWDVAWWQAEEDERTDLQRRAESEIGDRALYGALTRVTNTASDIVHGKAAVAAARGGVADEGLIRSAAGAAAMSCHQAALALVTRAGDNHPFAAKYRLFAAGRWPLAINNGVFFVF